MFKRRIFRLLAALLPLFALAACDSAIYDDEGDCSVTYRVNFRYDNNMAWSDAFARSVNSVHLYAFGSDGVLAWQKAESGEALKADGYSMLLDLPAGNYTLIAWCGIVGDTEDSFSVPEAQVGRTRIEELKCSLNRKHDWDGKAYTDRKLRPLFHGMCDVTLPAINDDGADLSYTMPLTKDTNHVRIILQQLSGEPVNEADFTFRIEDSNGLMNYDNRLLPDESVTYRAYDIRPGTAGLGIDDYPQLGRSLAVSPRAISSVNVAIADIDIARLVEGRNAILIIDKKDGTNAATIPLTDYALLLKNDGMEKQDYLDRQDEYALTFFLDENKKWIETSIIINSWKIVLNNVDFGTQDTAGN